MSDNNTTSSNNNVTFGALPVGGFVTKSAMSFKVPFTITLDSADAGRKIELSTDGVNFFLPTYDVTTASMLNVGIFAPIRCFKLTGAVSDPWNTL